MHDHNLDVILKYRVHSDISITDNFRKKTRNLYIFMFVFK